MAKKVLVIEDSPTDVEIVKNCLEKEGIEAVTAFSGQKGIEEALKVKPDMIILDLMLPDMSGFDVCRAIKNEADLKGTIVVIFSAKDKPADITEAFHAGADDYIIKLADPEFLVRKIKLYLGIHAGKSS